MIVDLITGAVIAAMVSLAGEYDVFIPFITNILCCFTLIIVYYFIGIDENSSINIGFFCWYLIFNKIFEFIIQKLS